MRASFRPVGVLLAIALISVALGKWIDADSLFVSLAHITPLEYLALSAFAALLLVPGVISKTAGGVLFGMKGIPLAFAGALIGSTSAFLVARILRRLGVCVRQPVLVRFDEALAQQGTRLVFLLRLSPLVPFNVLNYALGFGAVPLRACVLGGLGMAPTCAVYAYGGAMLHAANDGRPWWQWLALGVGLAASVLAALRIRAAAQDALNLETLSESAPK